MLEILRAKAILKPGMTPAWCPWRRPRLRAVVAISNLLYNIIHYIVYICHYVGQIPIYFIVISLYYISTCQCQLIHLMA